jgi:hypothetical protein
MSNEKVATGEAWLNGLEVEITDKQCNYKVRLRGWNDILACFRGERDVWGQARKELQGRKSGAPAFLGLFVEYYTSTAKQLDSLFEAAQRPDEVNVEQTWNQLRKRIESPPAPKIIYSKSSLGVFVLDLLHQEPKRAEGAYKYFNKQQIDYSVQSELNGFLDAYVFDRNLDSTLKGKTDVELRALQEARNNWEQKAHDIQISFDAQKTELSEWKAKFVAEQSTWVENAKEEYDKFRIQKGLELAKLEETYKEKLKLEAPVEYWNSRAESYRLRGRSWLIGLGCIIAVLEAFLALTLYDLPEAFHHRLFSGEPEAIKGVIVFVTILSFGAYLARVFARLTFSSFHIERDAEERAQLTLVYLALIKEKAVTEKEREIILQALFSRVETGLLGGDSSPTMPTATGVVEQLKGLK